MKKYILFFSIFLVCFIGRTQVNLQTGAAEFSMPIITFSDDINRISTSVSLNYIAGNGLKVNEVPSEVGSGWLLNFGGSIQRAQRGHPDDQKNNDTYFYPSQLHNNTEIQNFATWAENYFPNGYLYSEYQSSDVINNRFVYTAMFHDPGFPYKPHQRYQADREQDIFTYSFNGNTGSFVIGKPDQNGISVITPLNDSKIKIQRIAGDLSNTQNIRTTTSAFIITDQMGIEYLFSISPLTNVVEYRTSERYRPDGTFWSSHSFPLTTCYSGCDDSAPFETVNGIGVNVGTAKNSYVKNEWFLSQIRNPATQKAITFEYEDYDVNLDGSIKTSFTQTLDADPYKEQMSLIRTKMIETRKRIKKIVLDEKQTVEFDYSTNGRIDVPQTKSLKAVRSTYGGQLVNRWVFNYGYFVKNSIKSDVDVYTDEEKKWSRLCLKSVQKFGNSTEGDNPYEFEYYMGNENGMHSAVPPIFTFQTDASNYYNPDGKFLDPVSGTYSNTNAPYEPLNGSILSKELYKTLTTTSSIGNKATLEARNGVLKAVTYPMKGSLTYKYEQNLFANNIYVSGIRVNETAYYDGIDHAKDQVLEYRYIKEDGTSSAWGYETPVYAQIKKSRVYKSSPIVMYPGMNITGYTTKLFATVALASASGISLKSIGTVILQDDANREFLKATIITFFRHLFSSMYKDFERLETMKFPINYGTGLPFQYARTEVKYKLGSGNIGRTVREFTSTADYPEDVPSLGFPYAPKQRYVHWLYGLLKSETVFNNQNVKVSRKENFYVPVKYSLVNPQNLSQSWAAYRSSFDELLAAQNTNATDWVATDTYYPICGHVELRETKNYRYNLSGNDAIVSSATYQYHPSNNLVYLESVINSKGETIDTRTRYPADYDIPGANQLMRSSNMLNVPIATEIIRYKNGVPFLTSGLISEYAVTNGDPKVVKHHQFISQFPVAYGLVAFSNTQLIPSGTFYKVKSETEYNSEGMPVTVTTPGSVVCKVYDEENGYATATAINATASQVAYSSFESGSNGNWSVSGTINDVGFAITGKKCFTGVLSKSLPASGNYTVTAWCNTSGGVFTNGSPGTLITTLGDWKLFQWNLTNVNNVEVSGINMDEVRLYPANARMETCVVDPRFGKVAECNAAGKITYYEYDSMGRIIITRDENRNIIKTMEYHSKN